MSGTTSTGAFCTTSKEQAIKCVYTIICSALDIDAKKIKDTDRLIGDLGAESLDCLDIVFRLEKAFDIKIPRDEPTLKFGLQLTVKDYINYVCSKSF